MAGINSLGIGSGVLTSDLLDKLRAADEATILKPIETKMTLSTQKEDANKLLSGFMTTFKSSTASLGGEALYNARQVTGSNDNVTVSAEDGADLQSFSITNVSKAEKDIWGSGVMSSKTDPIAGISAAGTLTIKSGENSFDIEYTSGSSLDDIRQSINDLSGGTMTASVLQTGKDSYKLVISGTNTNEAITFTDSNSESNLTSALNLNNIQTAKGSSFDYNGITIQRSSNDISDLINGVTITLNTNQKDTDSASIVIGQNDTAINSEMNLFVTNFNLLASNLKDMTIYDEAKGVAGIFNTESLVKGITRELTNIITKTDSSGNSLYDYGITLDREGVMSFDASKFSSKLASNPKALELLFKGAPATPATDTTPAREEKIGIFQELDKKMFTYTGSNKLLANFTTQISDSKNSSISQYDKQKASLDMRYETLTKKFSAYDSLISRLNNQFSSLKMLIEADSNSSN